MRANVINIKLLKIINTFSKSALEQAEIFVDNGFEEFETVSTEMKNLFAKLIKIIGYDVFSQLIPEKPIK